MKLEHLTPEKHRAVLDGLWPGGLPVDITASARPAKVLVSRGVWIAECPDSPCGFAMVYCQGKNLICQEHRRSYQVALPEGWREIELTLLKRPVRNQNMNPGETLADLLRENREHGLD